MTDLEIPVGKRTAKYRFFEMLPAIMSYGTVLLPIILSIINPLFGAIFVTAFVIFWFVKAIGMAYRTSQGYNRLEKSRHVNWRERLEDIDSLDAAIKNYENNSDTGGGR